MAHPLELAARPPNDIGIDPLQGRTQPRLVEVAVIGDPAANARVAHLGQLLQGLVAAMISQRSTYSSTHGQSVCWRIALRSSSQSILSKKARTSRSSTQSQRQQRWRAWRTASIADLPVL